MDYDIFTSRHRRISVRVNDDEYFTIVQKAGVTGKGMATYLRDLALNAKEDDTDGPAINRLLNEKFLESLTLALAFTILTGSDQLRKEDEPMLVELAAKIKSNIR